MNEPPRISTEVQLFLRDKITSYEQLEALLFVKRRADERLSREVVAEALGVSKDEAGPALEHLCHENLLESQGTAPNCTFSYAPATPALSGLIDAHGEAYARNRLEIMRLMNAHAIERVRTDAMRMFADAFLLGRRGKKDG